METNNPDGASKPRRSLFDVLVEFEGRIYPESTMEQREAGAIASWPKPHLELIQGGATETVAERE